MPKESFEGEARVSLTPSAVQSLIKAGFKAVVIESGAGMGAKFSVSAQHYRHLALSCCTDRLLCLDTIKGYVATQLRIVHTVPTVHAVLHRDYTSSQHHA